MYFAVALIVFSAAYFFHSANAFIPTALSILLLIPLYLWQKVYRNKVRLSPEINASGKDALLSWVFTLFALALAVRIPSVILFGMSYEKTALVYLVILTVLVIEKTDLPVFGFKTHRITKSLLNGLIFFVVLDGIIMLLFYSLVYAFTNQMPVQSYDVMPFLYAMPFMTLCVGISEEGFFRGYVQTHFERITNPRAAILIQAVLFGGWHFVWNLSPFDPLGMAEYVTTTFLIGLLFGYFYSKTRNLTPLVFAHGLWNSFPQGIGTNSAAFNSFRTSSLASQALAMFLPYTVSSVITFLLIRHLGRNWIARPRKQQTAISTP